MRNENEDIGNDNAGIAFYSVLMGNTVPANSGMLAEVVNPKSERMILFDFLINNRDRHNGNLLVNLESLMRRLGIAIEGRFNEKGCSHYWA